MPARTKLRTHLKSGDLLLYAAEAEECRRSFKAFVIAAWKVLEPGTELKWNWHMDALCEHLQAVMDGEITRLIINIGPGHTKSTIVSQAFSAWSWTLNPGLRWLCASTDATLAIRDNRNTRYLIESEWYRACYGRDFKLNQTSFDMSGDQNLKSYFENDHRGYRMGMSICAKGIGRRADAQIIDDPHDPREGDTKRLEVLEWYAQTWTSRLNDQEHGRSIIVGQRIHDEDLCGVLLKRGGWEHLCLPEEYEPLRKCVTSIGWCDPRDRAGELLWPAKFPPVVIAKLKDDLGSLGYSAQYGQAPVPATGGQFKEKWFRYFSHEGDYYALETPQGPHRVAIKDCWRFTVVDLAVSTKQSADWTVIQTYDVTPQNELLLIDQIRGHYDNPTQQKLIRTTYFRLKPRFVQIEAIAYQLALIQQLRDEPVEPHKLRPNPVQVGDFLVRVGNIAALDATLSLCDFPTMKADVVKYEDGQYAQYGGLGVVHVQGDIFSFRYMCEKQGYCTIVRDVLPDDIKQIEQQERQKYSIPIKEYKPIKDKVSRASAPALLMENGKFYFLKSLAELYIIKTEYLQFPKGSHDDIVDCGSQAAEVIFVPSGPMMWSIDSDESDARSLETVPSGASPVPSIFPKIEDFDDGELYDMEVGDRW